MQDLIQKALAEPIKPTMDYSSRVPDNYAVRKSLQMLKDIGIDGMPRIKMSPGWNKKIQRANSPIALAWVLKGNDEVNVNDWTKEFEEANEGDPEALIQMAAALAHEKHHVDNGPDELSAYDRQLEVLNKLKAPKKLVDNVGRSRAYIQDLLSK